MDVNVVPSYRPLSALGNLAMLDVKHFTTKIPRREVFTGKTLFRNEPLAYREELARAHRRYTSRYAKEVAELDILIDALGPAGIIPDRIVPLSQRKAGTPDFELTFGNETVYCECTTAGDAPSMLWRFSVADLEIAANDMLEREPKLSKKLGSRFISFIPGLPLRSEDVPVAVDEIAALIASEDIDRYSSRYGVPVPTSFPLLSQAKTTAYTGKSERPMIAIQQPVSAFGGVPESVSEILFALRQKRAKCYEGYRPIWLVVGMTDVLRQLSTVVAKFDAVAPSLEPFERVFISSSRESFVVMPKGSAGT